MLDLIGAHRGDADLVIGGDFNLTVGERHPSEARRTDPLDPAVQARLRDEFGLINCWQAANPGVRLAQTLRWSNDPPVPYHCDGLFVPASWRPALRSCAAAAGPEWEALSDHNPVVVTFATDEAS
jgi:endonuclease/exonuclease/phosphatase family metal-dependent hydrolase